jgi:hypothetical protein
MITLDTIKYNLNLLNEVKSEYPILQDYEDGKVHLDSVNNVGLDSFVHLIDFIKKSNRYGQQIIYEKKLRFREVKLKIVELSSNEKIKSIFLKKSQSDFIKIFNDFKTYRRYTRSQNQSYCGALELVQPIVLNFFAQNSIEFNESHINNSFYTKRLHKPDLYCRELKMTQELLSMFIDFTVQKDFDLRKCNIKSFTTELNQRLRQFMHVDAGLLVKCISESKGFTVDKLYTVESSRVNYSGFLEIKLTDDRGITGFTPYSRFEEVSRQRGDILKTLGL